MVGSATPQRDLIRWLLRPLGEPAFLRLFVEEGAIQYPSRLLEEMFWSLHPDPEHPALGQKDAWQELAASKAQLGQRPVDWFMGTVELLRDRARRDRGFGEDLEELARFWSLPELFVPPTASVEVVDYHEIHCHLRGAVPFEALWCGWTSNERWRAALRKETIEHGAWKSTWAKLVKDVTLPFRQVPLHRTARWWFQLATRAVRVPRMRPRVVPYLAVCAGLRRELLHQRAEAGLSLFVQRFDRFSRVQRAGRAQAGRHTEKLVIEVLRKFEAEGAVALELRPTLEKTRIELQSKLLQVVRGYLEYFRTSARPLKLGLVPSLFKQEGISSKDSPAHVWKAQAQLWRSEVEALVEVLRSVPVLRYFVVGLDAAGKERGCPARAFSPAIELLHAHHRSMGVWNIRPGRGMRAAHLHAGASVEGMNAVEWDPIRLGLTMHAGEDFVDPLSGLRQIAETIDVLGMRRHDRLGHALAAGLPSKQVRAMLERRAGNGEVEAMDGRRFRLLKPRGEHLLDLAWAFHETPDRADRNLLGGWLSHTAAGIFGAPADAGRLAEALASRPHVEAWVPAVRYGEPGEVTTEDRVAVLVDEAWHSVFEAARGRLLNRIARLGLVIESCPTSNCAVANLQEAPIATFLKENQLRVTVATDDPALFGSWPSHELARPEIAPDHRDRLLAANRDASFVW